MKKYRGITNMSAKETAKRYILFIIGLFISGIGVAITKKYLEKV